MSKVSWPFSTDGLSGYFHQRKVSICFVFRSVTNGVFIIVIETIVSVYNFNPNISKGMPQMAFFPFALKVDGFGYITGEIWEAICSSCWVPWELGISSRLDHMGSRRGHELQFPLPTAFIFLASHYVDFQESPLLKTLQLWFHRSMDVQRKLVLFLWKEWGTWGRRKMLALWLCLVVLASVCIYILVFLYCAFASWSWRVV